MRILILLNGARDHRPFYSRVGIDLERRGHEVLYAIDSHFTDELEPGQELSPDRVRYFSDYFRDNYGREDLPPELARADIGALLRPDVDRWAQSRFALRADPRWVHTLVACLGHFFAGIFAEEAVDLVLYENVSNTFAFAALAVARHHGARYLGFVHSRLPGRMDVVEGTQSDMPRLHRLFAEYQAGAEPTDEIRQYTDRYLATRQSPDYMKTSARSRRGVLARYARPEALGRVLAAFRYATNHGDDAHYAFQLSNPWTAHAEQLEREARRALRTPVVRSFYYSDPDLSRPYFLYPTQFHPESSTSVDAAGFDDELTNIREIAAKLPHGTRLVVRDHPLAEARQPLHVYEAIRRLPNVDLTGPALDYEAVLAGATAVVCASSTVGYDALIRRKPVFVLGRPFYSFVPGCVRVHGFAELGDELARAHHLTVDERDVRAFISAYYAVSIPTLFDLESNRFRAGAEATVVAEVERAVDEKSHAPVIPLRGRRKLGSLVKAREAEPARNQRG